MFRCNFRKCGRDLHSKACFTRCMHVFCEQHNPERSRNICASCKEKLTRSEYVFINLEKDDPMLAFQITRSKATLSLKYFLDAISFISYQRSSELRFADYVHEKSSEKEKQIEDELAREIKRHSDELSRLKIEYKLEISKHDKLRDQVNETSRRIEKLAIKRNNFDDFSESYIKESPKLRKPRAPSFAYKQKYLPSPKLEKQGWCEKIINLTRQTDSASGKSDDSRFSFKKYRKYLSK